MDRIFLRDLSLETVIGTLPEERLKKQTLVLNVTLDLDLTRAGMTDDLAYSVNYQELESEIISLGNNSSFLLIERFASAVLDLCMAFPLVRRAEVTVDKPGALTHCRSVAVQLSRCRSGME